MVEENFQKGIQDLKNKGLRDNEKAVLFSQLKSYSINRPVVEISSWRNSFVWYTFLSRRNSFVYIGLAVLFLGGGSLVVASKDSLPGEFLYSLKVNVNEPLQGVTMIDGASKVSWEAEKVQTRLEEVELLAAQGKLSNKNTLELQTRLKKQKDSFLLAVENQEKAGSARTQVAEEAKVDLEDQIDVHARILAKLEDHSDAPQKEELKKIRQDFSEKRDVGVMAMQLSAPVSSGTNTNATNTKKKNNSTKSNTVNTQIKQTESLIKTAETNLLKVSNSSDSKLSKDLVSNTEDDLNEAKSYLDLSKKNKNDGDFDSASENLKQSNRVLKKVNTGIRQGIKINTESKKFNKYGNQSQRRDN